jgi:chromosome segregation ATPase
MAEGRVKEECGNSDISADTAYAQVMRMVNEKANTHNAIEKTLRQTTIRLAGEISRADETIAALDTMLAEQTKRADTTEAKIAELNGIKHELSAQVTDLKKRAETFENEKATAVKRVRVLERKLDIRDKDHARTEGALRSQLLIVRKELEDKDTRLESAEREILKYKQQILDIYNKMNKSSQPEAYISSPSPTKRKFKNDVEMSDKDSAAKQVKFDDWLESSSGREMYGG